VLPPVSDHDRAEAGKHYKRGRKQFKKGDLDAAEQEYTEAARLEPGNAIYVAERELTRTKRVSELLAEASHARLSGDHAEVADALAKAGKLDPHNSLVAEQVRAEADAIEPVILPGGDLSKIDSGVIELQPTPGKQPLHFKGPGQELITQTFQRFGIKATIDDTVMNQMVRADTEELNFQQSIDTAMLLTDSFYVPLDPHRVLVAKDTKPNRVKFEREFVETLYLPGLTPTEMQDAFNVIRQLLNVTQATQNKDQGTLTLRAPEQTLKTANSILTDLYQGHSQVLLTLTMYQVTRTREHTVGVELPNSFTLFNIPSEEAQLYAQYGTIIQQLIAQGLINPNNPLEILAALIASGQLSNSVFSQGFFVVGGGKTLSGVGFGGGTANVLLNSTDVRQLDKVQLRVGNTETATFRYGTRYPIITSSYSSVTAIPSTAGTNIAQLLAQYTGGAGVTTTTPDVQYQDLGLTLKAAPMVQKSGDISLKLELTVSALAGASLNNVPVLANRELKTTISLKEGEASLISSNMSRQETKALIGIPGLNDIPGFPATNADNELNVSELVIVLTPHVVRLEHPNGMGKLIILPIH
jgi:Flp pilus assembly secretin CpaC